MSSSSSLTPQGVADKLTELYALSDYQLGLQSAAVAIDFKWWLRNNFDLTPEQRLYLQGIGNRANAYFGKQCAVCFLNRLEIELIYPAPPVTPGYGKWTELLSHLRLAVNGNGSQNVTGSIEFVISYS